MKSSYLVAIQFISIFIILIPKSSVMILSFWWVLLVIATITALWIFTHNRVGNFNIVPEIKENAKLIVTGPYKYVRHPMYSSLILFMLGVILHNFNIINLLSLFVLIGAVSAKAFREESLWHLNDSDYEEYKKGTKMIIPFLL
jgi:protein-S-isoprenylcysteine O-methyltransferase Ste14